MASRPLSLHQFRFAAPVLGAALFVGGCTNNVTPDKAEPTSRGPKKSADGKTKYPKLDLPGDTAERRALDEIAWQKKATGLLDRMTDEKSSVALIPELLVLFQEHEQILARQRAHPSWNVPKEERDALEKKLRPQWEPINKKYIEALKQFDRSTQKEALAKQLEKKHGIDIRRMRVVRKEN